MRNSMKIFQLNDDQRGQLTDRLCYNELDYNTITKIVKGEGEYGNMDLIDVFQLAGKSKRSASIQAMKVIKYKANPHQKASYRISRQIIGQSMQLLRDCSVEAAHLAEQQVADFFNNLVKTQLYMSETMKESADAVKKFYLCSNCKENGVKLWRKENEPEVYCCTCTVAKSRYTLIDLQDDGTIFSEEFGRTNQIGDYFPAIMYEVENDKLVWCDKNQVEDDRCLRWWEELPSRPHRITNV